MYSTFHVRFWPVGQCIHVYSPAPSPKFLRTPGTTGENPYEILLFSPHDAFVASQLRAVVLR